MAMNIISKEKKEIKWVGLPTNSAQECQQLEVEMTVEYMCVVLISKLVKLDCKVSLTQIFVFYRRKRKERQERIRQKTAELQELILQVSK